MKRSLGVLLALCIVMVGACGDDDDESADAGGSTTTSTVDGGEQASGEFCPTYLELVSGDPTSDQIRALGDSAPDAAKEAIVTLADGFESGGDEFFGSDEFTEAFSVVGDAALDECADGTVDVTAIDYGFEGVPESADSGVLGVRFSNSGEEFHEMIVFRKNDDTSESFEEIFAMDDQDAAEALVTTVGAAFAPPGADTVGLYDVSDPGEYVAICFIPVGTTPEAEESEGPPHFTQGMITPFSVS